MTKDEIFQQVQSSLVEMFDLSAEQVTLDATLRESLDLDSIDAVDMAVRLQKMTGKRVDFASLKDLRTVGDVVELVSAHIESANVPDQA